MYDQVEMIDHFAKVKFLEIEGVYSQNSPDINNLALVKCEIIDDLFGGMDEGTAVYFMFSLSAYTKEWIEVSELENLLNHHRYFYVGFQINQFFNYIAEGETNFSQEFNDEYFSQTISTFTDLILPLTDDKLDFSAIDALYFQKNPDETKPAREIMICNFTDYFRDGMSEEEIKESVKKLR